MRLQEAAPQAVTLPIQMEPVCKEEPGRAVWLIVEHGCEHVDIVAEGRISISRADLRR